MALMQFSKSLLRSSLLIALAAASTCFGQDVSLSLSSDSASPGNLVTLNLSLAGTASDPPTSVEWTLDYLPGDFSSASVALGPVATASNKSLSCNNLAGVARCVVWGLNPTAISDGVVATVSLTVSNSTT